MAKPSLGMITLAGAFLALLTVPGIAARWTADGHAVVEMGPENHKLVNRYIEPAQRATKCDRDSPSDLIAVADHWIKLKREQVLVDIPQTWPEDTSRDGIKRQILDVRNSLVFALLHQARIARKANNAARAPQFEGRAFQLLDIMGSCDLSAIGSSRGYQNMILHDWMNDPPEMKSQEYAFLGHREDLKQTLATLSTLFLREQTLEQASKRSRIVTTSASDVAETIRNAPASYDSLYVLAGEVSKPDKSSTMISLAVRTAIRRVADQKRLLEQIGFQEPVDVAKNDAP